MEERVTRLEAQFEVMQENVSDLKQDVRRLDQKLDQKFDVIDRKHDSLKDAFNEFRVRVEQSFSRIMVWGLALHGTLAAGILTLIAKGFGWIK